MSERWFRAYEGAVDDPKLRRLSDAAFRGLFHIWCIASKNGGTLPPMEDIAFSLRMTPAKATALVNTLIEAGLIDDTGNGLQPHNWNGRQFKSDVSTSRVKLHRERKKAVSGNADETLHETPPDTETETEKKTPSLRSGAKATRIAADWQPSDADRWAARREGLPEPEIDREAAKFRDFWLGKAGKDAAKLDWPATWRNWIRRACDMRGISPAVNGKDATEADWRKRLEFARERRQWPSPKWGPKPNEPGCLIPPALIRPDDGKGWAEWGEHG